MNRKYNGSEEVWQTRPLVMERPRSVVSEISGLKVLHVFKETSCPVYVDVFQAYLERLLRFASTCGC